MVAFQAQTVPFVRMLEQRQRAVADEIDRRFMADDDQKQDHGEEFVLTQDIARFFGGSRSEEMRCLAAVHAASQRWRAGRR